MISNIIYDGFIHLMVHHNKNFTITQVDSPEKFNTIFTVDLHEVIINLLIY